jgi:hypothetical protein
MKSILIIWIRGAHENFLVFIIQCCPCPLGRGMSIFTFLVAPVIFKSYGKDMASDIVGHIFPGYFRYDLILAAVPLALFFLITVERKAFACAPGGPYRQYIYCI